MTVNRALATLRDRQAEQAKAPTNLANTRAAVGGFAPKASGAGTAGVKRVPLTKNETAVMENQLADLAGTEFKIDPQVRAAMISRASEVAVDPSSGYHRNPAGAMQAAVGEMAPGGFEDSAGILSSTKFVPKGGPSPAPKQIKSGGLPPQAQAALKEGIVTKFGNGQTWTLQGGVPVQVQ